MMKFLYTSAILVIAILGLSNLVGCQNSNSSEILDQENSIEIANESEVVLHFGSSESAMPENSIVRDLALSFEEETGIHIEFETIPDAQWRDYLKAELISGTASDADPFSLYEKIRPNINCIDLSDEAFISRMDQSVLPSISYEGHPYGISFVGTKIWVYSYNKEIFERLDLEIPTNYEELKTVCQAIKDDGIVPMWQMPQIGWHQVLPLFEVGPMYNAAYEDLYDKLNTNQMDVEEIPELLTVIQQINEFSELGFYGDDFFGNTDDMEAAAFAEGRLAMTLEEIGWSNELIEEYPEMSGKIGIFIMPWGGNQILGVNPTSDAYFGNANSVYEEEILEFFRFLTRNDNLQKRLDGEPKLLKLCWPEIDDKYPEEYAKYLEGFSTGNVFQVSVSYIDSQWMDIGKDIEEMYAGNLTPEEVLAGISRRRTELAKVFGDPYWE
jgi:raffinose/stachyose/melibiose transport system substrate-binding protein